MSDQKSIVAIDDLSVSFATDSGDVKAIDGVTLDVRPREVLAIVGESGSGKSVTARTIIGLLPETATANGAVMLQSKSGGDHDIVRTSGEKMRQLRGQEVAMVFQEASTALNPVFPVGWQIAEGIRAHTKVKRKEAQRMAVEILEKVGIPNAAERVKEYPHQFSGGQKQRIVIAQALVQSPGLILADEPTTALDVTVQAEILDLLRRARDEFETAVVIITHNMGVVADLADRVAVMYQGKLVEQAEVHELFASPKHDYTKALLDAVPHVGMGRSRAAARAVDRAEQRGRGEALEPAVVAKGLEITYAGRFGRSGFKAVKGVDFEIYPGEVLGLVGESGSGKTTIGRAMAGLTPVSGGSMTVLGTEMLGVRERDFKPLRSDIGFVFQDPATSFNPLLTIGQNVAEPFIVHGKAENAEDAQQQVHDLLESVQLPKAFADRFPHELSGGQRQRASLARGIALKPKLLIADEPTSALDVSVQARVLELFNELQDEFGFACLFISHDLAVVDMLADRIAVLLHGEMVEEGTGAEVLGDPKHPYTQRLLASLPVPDPVEQAKRRERLHELQSQ
ncbi:dipeptide ABC transporter ATP-binding protein [Agrococcus casei]|uniref:dipeptide ABC transporter ATP-binding protein n=1 Tax=Agrococcus casei TaxID=343512 RepID=UPI003F8F19CF